MIIKAKRSKLFAQHRGLGDTVESIARHSGIAKAVKAFERATGVPCRCPDRQALLNRLVPYRTGTATPARGDGEAAAAVTR